MITRIVRMEFRKKSVPEFLDLFRKSCTSIRAFDGCLSLNLLQDDSQSNVYFTISTWEGEHALETYRNSALFRQTWKQTKALFKARADAWSLTTYISL